jgi:protein SCO1
MTRRFGKRPFCMSLLLTMLLLVLLLALYGHPPAARCEEVHQHSDAQETTVGLDEQLGSRIPLDLAFRDETGTQVRLGDLISGPTIILPVYFSCTNVCYNLQWGLARILPQIRNKPGTEYRVISVSFDESDTPQLAAKFKRVYLTSMHAPFPEDGWRFLTGDTASIRLLTAAAGYRFQRKGRDFIHPAASLVVDGNGTIVRYLYGTTFLSKDLSLALIEAREGTSGTTVRKVMDFCFSFDPQQKTYVFNLLRVSATVVILCTGGFLAFLLLSSKKRTRRQPRK